MYSYICTYKSEFSIEAIQETTFGECYETQHIDFSEANLLKTVLVPIYMKGSLNLSCTYSTSTSTQLRKFYYSKILLNSF